MRFSRPKREIRFRQVSQNTGYASTFKDGYEDQEDRHRRSAAGHLSPGSVYPGGFRVFSVMDKTNGTIVSRLSCRANFPTGSRPWERWRPRKRYPGIVGIPSRCRRWRFMARPTSLPPTRAAHRRLPPDRLRIFQIGRPMWHNETNAKEIRSTLEFLRASADEDGSTASLNADLYDPVGNLFSSAGANAFPRLYHSGALLLPDATVMVVGANPQRGVYEPHVEIYSPAYLFNTTVWAPPPARV